MDTPHREYWNRNISNWSRYYLEISHPDEELIGPQWLRPLYRQFLMPIEARLMARRFRLTMDFIQGHVTAGMVAADIGCGSGIFTVEMLKRGARVRAIDFAESSLAITRRAVEKLVPERSAEVDYHLLDVSRKRLPTSDVALAMGVTPYIRHVDAFFANVLPTTHLLYCLFLDSEHWINRVRALVPILNVRRLTFCNRDEVDRMIAQNGWRTVSRRRFASGFLDLAQPGSSSRLHTS